MCRRRTSRAPRHWTARHTTPALKLLPGPLPRVLRVQRGGGSAPQPRSCPISLPWPPGTSPPPPPPPRRGAGAPTTSFSSPNKDLPVPLGELLSWVSDISRSWTGSRGAPEAAAARPCSPAQCGWMSIPPPLIAAVEPVPRPETAPEDTGTFSLTLCTCQSPQPETGPTVPEQPMAQEAPAGSPGPRLPHTLPPPWAWPPGVVSGSLRISKTSPPSHLLSSATCKPSHVTLRLWCHYCSHYPVWLCMRCRCSRLQGSPHSRGPPHPERHSLGQWGPIHYPNASLFGGKTLNLYIPRSVCKRSSADPGLPCKGSKGESSETSRQLCVICSPPWPCHRGRGLPLPPAASCPGLHGLPQVVVKCVGVPGVWPAPGAGAAPQHWAWCTVVLPGTERGHRAVPRAAPGWWHSWRCWEINVGASGPPILGSGSCWCCGGF